MNKKQLLLSIFSINLALVKVTYVSETPSSTLSWQQVVAPLIGGVVSVGLNAYFENARARRIQQDAPLPVQIYNVRIEGVQPRIPALTFNVRKPKQPVDFYVVKKQAESKPVDFKLNPHAQPFETEFTRAWSAKLKSMKEASQ